MKLQLVFVAILTRKLWSLSKSGRLGCFEHGIGRKVDNG